VTAFSKHEVEGTSRNRDRFSDRLPLRATRALDMSILGEKLQDLESGFRDLLNAFLTSDPLLSYCV
jgi:hypothetical protein